jgi:hygromycin-B 7''-O-kinase
MNHDPNDPILSNELILEIANRHLSAYHVTGVEESGGEARAYYIDTDILLKVQRPHRVRERTSQEREVLFLNALGAFSEVTVPEVFGHGRENGQIEYTLMSRMPGKAMREVKPTGERRTEILYNLGRMLYFLHNLPDQEELLESGFFPVDHDRHALAERVIRPLQDVADRISRRNLEWTSKLTPQDIVEKVSETIQYDEKRALHSNPALSHTFVDPESHTLTGLIDLGDAYISHPSNDLRRCLSPLDRQDIFSGYNTLRQADDSFMSVWIANQLLSDFICIAQDNGFRPDAVKEVDEIVKNYL